MLKSGIANSRYDAVAALFARLAYLEGKSEQGKDNARLWIRAAKASLLLAGLGDHEAKVEATRLVRLYEKQDDRIPVSGEG